MRRIATIAAALAVLLVAAMATPAVSSGQISGEYLEMRSCDVYTGPCFANAEVGVTGREAILAWSIEKGQHRGVDLSGLKVVMALCASDTLGYGGGVVVHPEPIKSVILADANASSEQREALVDFAKTHAGKVVGDVQRVDFVKISMKLDHIEMAASLKAGKEVEITTRKLGDGDCICTNETVFYPPLALVDNYAPAFTLQGAFQGRGLNVTWACPDSRSAFLATFAY